MSNDKKNHFLKNEQLMVKKFKIKQGKTSEDLQMVELSD